MLWSQWTPSKNGILKMDVSRLSTLFSRVLAISALDPMSDGCTMDASAFCSGDKRLVGVTRRFLVPALRVSRCSSASWYTLQTIWISRNSSLTLSTRLWAGWLLAMYDGDSVTFNALYHAIAFFYWNSLLFLPNSHFTRLRCCCLSRIIFWPSFDWKRFIPL